MVKLFGKDAGEGSLCLHWTGPVSTLKNAGKP